VTDKQHAYIYIYFFVRAYDEYQGKLV